MKMKIIQDFSFEQLWDFYLEANFIYKQKLDSLRDNLEEIKDTWDKLLQSGKEINYTTLRKTENGEATNSISLILYYETTWIFQHMVSKRNPKGMTEVLQDACKWLYRNPHSEYMKVYWRPNNLAPEFMFTSMGAYFKGIPNSYLFELFNYFEFKIEHIAGRLNKYSEYKSEIVTENKELSQIANILKKNLHPLIVKSDSLDEISLLLPITNRAFSMNNLKRSRNFISTKKDGKIVAIAAVENASIGINLSYYFNKFNFYYIDCECSIEEKRKIVNNLLIKIMEYYQDLDRDFLVTMCNQEFTEILIKIGVEPIKQYRCMSLARKDSKDDSKLGGFYQATVFLKEFYKQKIKVTNI